MLHGKYDLYVWPAYAISALVILWMTVDSLWRARRWRAEAERREKARREGQSR